MAQLVNEQEQQEAVKALTDLISVPSFNQPAEDGAPFGRGIRNALDKMMEICKGLGFKTYEDPAGYYGYAEVGEGDKIFGVICHLDTVPAGDPKTWEHDPFKGTVVNDAVYGRGSQDDKGPGIAALFAVKALMDHGYKFNGFASSTELMRKSFGGELPSITRRKARLIVVFLLMLNFH